MADFARELQELMTSDRLAEVLIVHDVTEQLARVMKQKRWGVRRLARELGVSPAQVSKWLRARNLTLRTVARIATVLGCEVRVSVTPRTRVWGGDKESALTWLSSVRWTKPAGGTRQRFEGEPDSPEVLAA